MRLRAVAALAFTAITIIQSAHADWMPLTGAETAPNIAEVTVLDDRVRVALEVYVGDIATFEAIVPDEWLKENAATRAPLSERLQKFAAETFRIVTDDGKTLQAELKLVEPRLRKDRYAPFAGMIDPSTRSLAPAPPDDKRVLYAELDYPFRGKPKHLTLIPPLDAQGRPATTIGFIAYHKAVPIIDFRYLVQSERLTLDWDDPWYTAFDNPNLTRHHKSALMTFLYAEPREVRQEVLIRVRELQQWIDLGVRNGTMLESADQDRIRLRARAFFADRNPASIDAVPATPASIQVEFLEISLTGLKVIEDVRSIDPATAMLGIMLSYPVKRLPQQVAVKWDLFSDRVTQIPATSIDPAGPFPGIIEANDPIFEWHNLLRHYVEPQVSPVVLADGRSIGVPALSVPLLILALGMSALVVRPAILSRQIWVVSTVVAIAAAVSLWHIVVINAPDPLGRQPDEAPAAQILSAVLTNVNSAYVEKDPAALYQALQMVVAAEALTDVKQELDRALAIKIVGGGIARVDSVENVTVKNVAAIDGQSGFRGLAEWTAKASAGHWGHLHQRTIQFRALVELRRVDGAWKLAGITVTDTRMET